MASEQKVRQYLAYWFQLGKGVVLQGGNEVLHPNPVIQGNQYSQAFEACWQQVLSPESGDCYLEGTTQTIAELLTPGWEIDACSRCSMPVPIKNLGAVSSLDCPCIDLPEWPNMEVPQPRSPVDSQTLLAQIRDRLNKVNRQ
ncbi:hypothetical protein K9N68_27335 [Kovacikia minuta CCNUW1]|uniref:hypothetical protein n=1 Tax=Kovacikia minuta TaxID=2931930 RepID=UPI001CCE13F3|nr:hypothetical protein [Kovacikia minuta]UBF25288.1 hypothetical protein K9N68_27335 [Kovacikia minuta CCNUW1]